VRGEEATPGTQEFDLPGAAVYSLALVLVVWGVSLLPQTLAIWIIAAGVCVGVLFLWLMTRSKHPLLNLTMFKGDRPFTFSNLAALVNYSGTWAVSFLLSLYLQYAKGLGPEAAGIVLITSPAVQAIFSPLAGRLSDRIEPRLLSSCGMALTAVGIGLLALVTQSASLPFIITCLALLGLGFSFFSSPNVNAVMSSARPEYYGVASATLATMRQIGMMLSTAICWVVFALFIGRVEITAENTPELISSARVAFLIFAALCASAIYFSLARGKIHVAAQQSATIDPETPRELPR
jgi:MFS family permease